MILGIVLTAGAWAAEVIPQVEIDGKVYESVRWGPVNQGKIVLIHSRGAAFIPVEKIPENYRQQLGITLPAAPAPCPSLRAEPCRTYVAPAAAVRR